MNAFALLLVFILGLPIVFFGVTLGVTLVARAVHWATAVARCWARGGPSWWATRSAAAELVAEEAAALRERGWTDPDKVARTARRRAAVVAGYKAVRAACDLIEAEHWVAVADSLGGCTFTVEADETGRVGVAAYVDGDWWVDAADAIGDRGAADVAARGWYLHKWGDLTAGPGAGLRHPEVDVFDPAADWPAARAATAARIG